MRSGKLALLAWLAAAALLAPASRGAAASPGSVEGEDEDDAPPVPAVAIAGPPVGEVLAAAYRAAGLDRDPARGWVRRARVAGLVPSVMVRTGRNTSSMVPLMTEAPPSPGLWPEIGTMRTEQT